MQFAKQQRFSKYIISAIAAFLFTIIVLEGSFVSDSKTLISIFHSSSKSFSDVLNKNGMNDYISPSNIKSEKGKNIIIISLESFERDFLHNEYSALTPNLQQLKNNWSYYDMEENVGSSWTSGSLYTYLTGFPAYFGIHGNSIFESAYHSEITGISHIFKKAGYRSIYLNGNTDHSGVKEMLNTFDFDLVIDYKNIKATGYESTYGLRDKDLFEVAKKEVESANASSQPFAMIISTTDTHFPYGIYDERMEDVISPKKSNLEFMIAAVDYMLGEFLAFLDRKNLIDNTVIYIFPDHLMMGNPTIFSNPDKRGLYVITNAKKQKIDIDTTQTIYQIDLPNIILSGAEIKHNAKFLADYIKGDKNLYLQKNVLTLTELNTNGLLRIDSEPYSVPDSTVHYKSYKTDTLRYIAHGGGKIDRFTFTNSVEALDYNYKKGFRIFEIDILETSDGAFVASSNWDYWAMVTNFKGKMPVSKKEFMKHKIHSKYTPLDMNGINEWFVKHPDAILLTDNVNKPVKFSSQFIDKNRLMMQLFDIDSIKTAIALNIRSAIPSQSVIQTLDKNDVLELKKIGVKNISISRRFLNNNKNLLLEYKKNGINSYVYNLNPDVGINEEYVTKYEMDYIYGIFADEWSFE